LQFAVQKMQTILSGVCEPDDDDLRPRAFEKSFVIVLIFGSSDL